MAAIACYRKYQIGVFCGFWLLLLLDKFSHEKEMAYPWKVISGTMCSDFPKELAWNYHCTGTMLLGTAQLGPSLLGAHLLPKRNHINVPALNPG